MAALDKHPQPQAAAAAPLLLRRQRCSHSVGLLLPAVCHELLLHILLHCRGDLAPAAAATASA